MNRCPLVFLPERERRAIEAFVGRIWQTYPEKVQQIILFGSKVRGDSHATSDIDILLIVDEEEWRFRHARASRRAVRAECQGLHAVQLQLGYARVDGL